MTDQNERQSRRRGQVIALGDGKFKIRVALARDGAGRRKYHTETIRVAASTPKQALKEAEKRCTQLLAEVDTGTFFQPARGTLKDYLEKEWLPQKRREGLRPHTLASYQRIVTSNIVPHLGAVALADLRPTHVQGFYNALQDRALSGGTRGLVKTILRMALAQAVAWGHLRTNPALGVRVPDSRRRARLSRAFSVAEALKFIEAAQADPDGLLYLIQLTTGMRPEEVLGLRDSDLELATACDPQTGDERERGLAHVRQVAVRAPDGWQFLPPKTEKGRRNVYFPARLYHQLPSHYERRAEMQRIAGARWREHGLVFPAAEGQPQHQHGTYTGRFRRILKAARLGREFTPYSLRYSYATLALLSGELDKTVSEQMGHTCTDFTKEVYVQVLPEMRQAASDKLERLLFSEAGTPLAHIVSDATM